MLETILFYGFLAATAVQLYFWLFFFGKLARHPVEEIPGTPQSSIVNRQSSIPFPPVSIIICARNEEANLERHLDRILNQTYRSLEILLVLHKSSDNSLNVLSSLQRKFSHLRIVVCDDERAGKNRPCERD
ncbi:MAG: glycosyltransferase family 2 protein [Saprospiraceae bacterium]|nr:glycosyltransferase family 2 protein [Saprospiraceae bacterium]